MFILTQILKNIFKRLRASLTLFAISTILILFVIIYNENINRIENQLLDHSIYVPVTGQISNRNGTMLEGLLIPSRFSSEILLSEHTGDVQVVTSFRGFSQNADGYQSDESMGIPISSVTNIALYAENKNITIEWLPGYDEVLFDALDSLVIINNEVKDEVYWLTNNSIILELHFFRPGNFRTMELDYFQTLDLLVAGFFELEDDTLHNTVSSKLIMPHQFIYQTFQEEGVNFHHESTSFRINNPLELSSFKEDMSVSGFYQLNVTADIRDNIGDTLIIDDSEFIYGVTPLMQTLDLQQRFYPVVFVAIGLIVFFVSYLMLQSRRQEFLIFRLLGVSKGSCFSMYFIEQTVIFILGKIVAVLLSVIFISQVGIRELFPLLITYLCFSIGCIASLLFMERKSIMIAVSGRE
jgi:hypothetical protein